MDFIPNCTRNFLEDIDLCSIEFTAPVSGTYPPALVAEADGRLAERLTNQSDEVVVDFLLGRLTEMFGDISLPDLLTAHVLRPWGLPFFAKNSSGRGAARLAGKPMGRLFFAGDYVSHNVGTVAGAFLSGIAAAHDVSCELKGQGLRFEELPALAPMIDEACAEKKIALHGRCKVTLWDVLYACSALHRLEDESGRSCFVQGRDRWHEASAWWWIGRWRGSVMRSAEHLHKLAQSFLRRFHDSTPGAIRTEF